MGKNKAKRFAENLTFKCMVQPEFDEYFRNEYPLKGHWHSDFFGNDNPIVLELGCGRGEYTVALGEKYSDKNFIGVDIKGARMWRGAKTATQQGLSNVGFLRSRIEFIDSFFAEGEVDEIWITFADPQLHKRRANKRLTSPYFLAQYARFLNKNGVIHLKTDSRHLHCYTKAVLEANGIEPMSCISDIYNTPPVDELLKIQTTYEQRFLAQGLPITYLRWSLGDKKEFLSPDFQADQRPVHLDMYRLGAPTVEIDPKSGFCFGVVRAIDMAEELLHTQGSASSLGDIVHNRVEVSRLEHLGLRTVAHKDIPAIHDTLLIRAHGEPPTTYKQAKELNINVVDATCPVVAHLQQSVRKAWEKMQEVDGQVVILGKRGHAEVVGLTGQIDEQAIIVENVDDLAQVDFARPIYLLSQTTQSISLFDTIKKELLERAHDAQQVTIHDTICRQVAGRNPHLREFAARYDVVLFVSGRKSSNGAALFAVCQSVNPHSYMVEEPSEIQSQWLEGARSIGICGATSTPKWLMEKVAQALLF